jgi:hypothetical protein
MPSRHVRAAVLVATAALVLGCAAKTQMMTSWSAPGASKKNVKRVLVIGVSQDDSIRRTFEDDFVGRFLSLGYYAVPGYKWFPDASKFDKDAIAAKLKEEGFTNVLVTRLVGKNSVTTTTGPTVVAGYGGYAPYGPGWYGGWGSYYTMGYSTAYVSPGYTTTTDVVTLETNFYDATKEQDALLWSGQSQTNIDPTAGGQRQSTIDSVIGTVVYEMRAKNII